MNTTTVAVMGMSCGSCALSVREEIRDIPGVHTVDVDLGSGTVVIESEAPGPHVSAPSDNASRRPPRPARPWPPEDAGHRVPISIGMHTMLRPALVFAIIAGT